MPVPFKLTCRQHDAAKRHSVRGSILPVKQPPVAII